MELQQRDVSLLSEVCFFALYFVLKASQQAGGNTHPLESFLFGFLVDQLRPTSRKPNALDNKTGEKKQQLLEKLLMSPPKNENLIVNQLTIAEDVMKLIELWLAAKQTFINELVATTPQSMLRDSSTFDIEMFVQNIVNSFKLLVYLLRTCPTLSNVVDLYPVLEENTDVNKEYEKNSSSLTKALSIVKNLRSLSTSQKSFEFSKTETLTGQQPRAAAESSLQAVASVGEQSTLDGKSELSAVVDKQETKVERENIATSDSIAEEKQDSHESSTSTTPATEAKLAISSSDQVRVHDLVKKIHAFVKQSSKDFTFLSVNTATIFELLLQNLLDIEQSHIWLNTGNKDNHIAHIFRAQACYFLQIVMDNVNVDFNSVQLNAATSRSLISNKSWDILRELFKSSRSLEVLRHVGLLTMKLLCLTQPLIKYSQSLDGEADGQISSLNFFPLSYMQVHRLNSIIHEGLLNDQRTFNAEEVTIWWSLQVSKFICLPPHTSS